MKLTELEEDVEVISGEVENDDKAEDEKEELEETAQDLADALELIDELSTFLKHICHKRRISRLAEAEIERLIEDADEFMFQYDVYDVEGKKED